MGPGTTDWDGIKEYTTVFESISSYPGDTTNSTTTSILRRDKWEQDYPAKATAKLLMDPRNFGLEKSVSALDTIRWIRRAENTSDTQRADSAQMEKEAGF